MEVSVRKEGKNIFVTIDGVEKPLYTWAKEFGIQEQTLWYRIKAEWPPEAWFRETNGGKGMPQRTKKMKQRGCHDCADFNRVCQHKECPYHELDGYKTYDEYMKKSKKNGFVKLLESLG